MTAEDPPAPGLLEVGRVARAHGLRGEVALDMVTDRPERTAVGAVFDTRLGPKVIAEARPHQQRWLVRFEGAESREAADALRGLVLWAEPIEDADELWVHELVGTRVIDAEGIERGEVVAVVDNPAADLLELADGTLVPVVFVTGPPEGGVVRVDTPEGLFEL